MRESGTRQFEAQDAAASGLDGEALATRLRAAEQACLRPDGSIAYDWMVMHIWLAHCDVLRRAYQAANDNALGGRTQNEVFDASLKRHFPLFQQLVPELLPLFGEFARAKAFHFWKKEGRAASVVADPEFIARARQEGLPVCEDDLLYAMGPDGPSGRETFQRVLDHVARDRSH